MSERVLAYYKRQFLNTEDHGGIAFVEAIVEEAAKTTHGVEASLTIGDCNRIVTLDFGFYNLNDLPNVRQKITRLRSVLRMFAESLDEQLEVYANKAKEE